MAVEVDQQWGIRIAGQHSLDVIQGHRGPTTARVRGRCDSAGLIVLIAFDSRTSTPWASFLLHDVRMCPPDFTADQYTATDLRRLAFEMDEDENAMIAVSKRTRIITRSRYSAWFHPGKENAAVRAARIKSQAAKPHSFANALRTTCSTLSKVDRLLLNARPGRTGAKWVPAEGARSIKTF